MGWDGVGWGCERGEMRSYCLGVIGLENRIAQGEWAGSERNYVTVVTISIIYHSKFTIK